MCKWSTQLGICCRLQAGCMVLLFLHKHCLQFCNISQSPTNIVVRTEFNPQLSIWITGGSSQARKQLLNQTLKLRAWSERLSLTSSAAQNGNIGGVRFFGCRKPEGQERGLTLSSSVPYQLKLLASSAHSYYYFPLSRMKRKGTLERTLLGSSAMTEEFLPQGALPGSVLTQKPLEGRLRWIFIKRNFTSPDGPLLMWLNCHGLFSLPYSSTVPVN